MKYINEYILYNNRVDLYVTDSTIYTLYLNKFSGIAYYRMKEPGIKHPGIYIGIDSNGIQYVAHNHGMYGKPTLVSLEEFTNGKPIYHYPEFATNAPIVVIEKALNGILKGEKYTLLSFNCQAFVNDAINNTRKSPAVGNAIVGTLAIGLCIALFSGSSSKQ